MSTVEQALTALAGHVMGTRGARVPMIPQNSPTLIGRDGLVHIDGQPADLNHPADVPVPTVVGSGNPLTALTTPPPDGVYVRHLDLASSAGPAALAQMHARPSGLPVRPLGSFLAPSGYRGGEAA